MTGGALHIAYVTDSMADVRMIEGLGRRAKVTIVAPSVLGDRVTNFWPPRPPAVATKALLPGGRPAFVLRGAWWLVRNRRDVDVAFALDNLTAALAATLARIFGGPPVVIQVGRPTLDYLRCQPKSLRWLIRLVIATVLVQVNERRAASIGAVSDYCAAQCRAHNRNVRFIPWYGVDTDAFSPRLGRREARRRLGLPVDTPVVMLRSRIAPEKDPATFARAVQRLRDEGRTITAVYMGGEVAEMDAVALALGVEVESRKPADVDEIPVWYEAADVDVQTSLAEGLGVSPLEALASGTPVVVSDVGGLPQVVDRGRVGTLVAVGDDQALAEAIARYLDDPELAARHAESGRAWVIERFDVEDAFDAWIELAADAAQPARLPFGVAARVLFVDHETRLSGGQRDLVDLARALATHPTELHAAVPGEGPLGDSLSAQGVQVHHVEMAEGLRKVSRWDLASRPWKVVGHAGEVIRSARALSALSRRLQPDIVHTNSMKAHLLAIPAARAAKAPLVWHVRDILQAGWLRRVMVLAASLATARVISLSEVAAEPFRWGAVGRRVRVVHNGVRPEPHDAADVEHWRSALGAPDDETLVVLVGQIARWKGQDVFIEAAARVAAAWTRARFAIVGECLFPENEGAFDASIRRRARELGLDDRIVFAGAAERIEPVMAAADIVVHASRLPEPFGRVIIEAMAQSTPVISTSIGSGPELVPSSVGRLVPPADPGALADALDELLADADVRADLGRAAAERAKEFDIAFTGDGVLAVWDELLR